MAKSIKSYNTQLSRLGRLWQLSENTPLGRILARQIDEVVSRRQDFMLKLGPVDPRSFLESVLAAAPRNRLPPEARNALEQAVTLRGRLQVIHIDDFDEPNRSANIYFLGFDDGTRLRLYFTAPPPASANSLVRLRGVRLADVFVVDPNAAEALVVEEPARIAGGTGPQRTLVFLINFRDSPPEPFTRARARQLVFEEQVQAFYNEQSYGRVSFEGEVSDWIAVDMMTPPDVCEAVSIEDDDPAGEPLRDYILANSINLQNYNQVLYLINMGGRACGSVGTWRLRVFGDIYFLAQAWVGSAFWALPSWGAWWGFHPFVWRVFDGVVAHEWGHNLGLPHAQGWDCGEAVLYGSCAEDEYGNYFDNMGFGDGSLHFNALAKELLGWIRPGEILTINSSGQYVLNPLELAGSAIKAAKITKDNRMLFYLEYRRPVGFDANLNSQNQQGLLVNFPNPDRLEQARLLDIRPTSAAWPGDLFGGATVNSDSVFLDEQNNLQIGPLVNVTPEAITFDVNFNAGYRWLPLY